jgi:predicted nucleotidyltransferase component of viral defense system
MGDQMKFHEAKEFEDAVNAAADKFGMRPSFVEKDYWVTYALKNLSRAEEAKSTVFKGGTSLSKVYSCINRFSEDIDLAIITTAGQSQSLVKKQLKAVDLAASGSLTLLDDPPPVRKGKNRFSCYQYPRRGEASLITKPYIRLEISAFANPIPHFQAQIGSYLGKFLEEAGYANQVMEYDLEFFPLLVLSIERTCCEKLLSLIRLSYRGPDELRQKIRHFHDLALIIADHRIQEMLSTGDHSILHAAFNDDRNISTFQGAWIERPFSEAPLFTDFDAIWSSIKEQYHSELSQLSWAESIPGDSEVKAALFQLLEFVRDYGR